MTVQSMDIHASSREIIKVEFRDLQTFYVCHIHSLSRIPEEGFSIRLYIDSPEDITKLKNEVLWAYEKMLKENKK